MEVEIKSMTELQREEGEELEVECRQPDEVVEHQVGHIRLKYCRGIPDQKSLNHEEPNQPPIRLEKITAPNLAPSIADCDNESTHRRGHSIQQNDGVDLDKQSDALTNYVQKNTILLVAIGILLVSLGKSLTLTVLEFMGVALFFSGLGLFAGAEIAIRRSSAT